MLDFYRPPVRVPTSLASPRLTIRKIHVSDADEYSALFADSFVGHLDAWSPPTPPEAYADKARRYARDYIMAALEKWDEGTDYRFFIYAKDTEPPNAIVGQIGLTNLVRGVLQSCFIGYWIGKSYIGQGYATEATKLALTFAFEHLKLHRASLWIGVDNLASLRIPEKLGLRREGTVQRALFLGGKWQDTHVFAITLEEWEARREEFQHGINVP
ncbi:MAG: GNAT family protein [Bacteroidota bacterium]|nr:GNAT family protein [Bacteroidota bacterium]MDP4232016.1 GNAT family protein [Bacteroidota bacterium]MDP4241277.1 GNAT family protein [Bacteroidota bacterium]MDP4286669.1 GNAT family protein [Bacteroidota bacterium]